MPVGRAARRFREIINDFRLQDIKGDGSRRCDVPRSIHRLDAIVEVLIFRGGEVDREVFGNDATKIGGIRDIQTVFEGLFGVRGFHIKTS